MDIIVDILYRLPVKTLLRFRCLSKEFHSLIDSPGFINHHLHIQHQSSNPKLFVYYRTGTDLQVLILNTDSLHNAPVDFYHGHIPLIPEFSSGHEVVIGSCDGLVALANTWYNNVVLFNISSRMHKIIPNYFIHYQFYSDDEDYTWGPCGGFRTDITDAVAYGFGRGVAFDDYKLFMVNSLGDFDFNITTVSVYSLKTESWRTVADVTNLCLDYNGMATLLGATLNWLVSDNMNRKQYIFSFDLETENISSMPLADDICDDVLWDSEIYLTAKGDCLCVLEGPCTEDDFYYVWVMKEYGVKESWTKMYTLSLDDLPSCSGFAFSKYGDKAFYSHRCRKISVLNLEEDRCEINKVLPSSPPVFLHLCVESLVWPLSNT